MLSRKYKIIRKAIEEDYLLFEDQIFNIEPLQGQIWPNSEMTVTVTFRPDKALYYRAFAYCNISCSDKRLELTLEGDGRGPSATLSFHEKDIGDIFIN